MPHGGWVLCFNQVAGCVEGFIWGFEFPLLLSELAKLGALLSPLCLCRSHREGILEVYLSYDHWRSVPHNSRFAKLGDSLDGILVQVLS